MLFCNGKRCNYKKNIQRRSFGKVIDIFSGDESIMCNLYINSYNSFPDIKKEDMMRGFKTLTDSMAKLAETLSSMSKSMVNISKSMKPAKSAPLKIE